VIGCESSDEIISSTKVDESTTIQVLRKNYHATSPYVWVVQIKRNKFHVGTSSDVARVVDADEIRVRPLKDGLFEVVVLGGRMTSSEDEKCSLIGKCLKFNYVYRPE
jgi:hypothetical protein